MGANPAPALAGWYWLAMTYGRSRQLAAEPVKAGRDLVIEEDQHDDNDQDRETEDDPVLDQPLTCG